MKEKDDIDLLIEELKISDAAPAEVLAEAPAAEPTATFASEPGVKPAVKKKKKKAVSKTAEAAETSEAAAEPHKKKKKSSTTGKKEIASAKKSSATGMKSSATKKKKRKKKNGLLIFTIFLAALAVFVVSGVMLLKIYLEYNAGTSNYQTVSDQYVKEDQGPTVTVGGGNSANRDIVSYHLPAIDLAALKSQYPEAVGWILIPDTKVNYPIVQAADDNYYLNHMPNGAVNSSGSIFMESLNEPDFSDLNTIIYGHNMKNGSMFGELKKYNKEEFYLEHPCFYIYTEEGIREYEIFSVHVVNEVGMYYNIGFQTNQEYQSYLNQSYQYSMYDTGIVPGTDDRVVTLSTCTSSDTKRLILQGIKGRLFENDEPGLNNT